jgi:hypothetical protein
MVDSPFLVFTVITAPAVMTNAAAVMSLTTANRLARAVDRARVLVAELKKPPDDDPEERQFHLREVETARNRAELLIQSLRCFQISFAAFALAAMLALIGASASLVVPQTWAHMALLLVLPCMVVAVSSILIGARLIVIESAMAYQILREESAHVVRSLIITPKE